MRDNNNWQDTAQIDPPDDLLGIISLADYNLFPNIKKLLVIGCISPIGSTEAKRAASKVRRLEISFCTRIGD